MDTSRLTREIHPMPVDIEERLNSEELMEAYRRRPPYQQNDYIGWILRAKRPETRNNRIEQMIRELRDGCLYMKMKYGKNDKVR